MFKARSYLAIILVAIVSTLTIAAIPRQIAYQGILTDATGNAKPDGKYSFSFALYTVATGGTAVPGFAQVESLTIKNGVFSTLLGKTGGITLPFDAPYWLGVSVNGTAMGQRVALGSGAYALRSDVADSAAKVNKAFVVDSSLKVSRTFVVDSSRKAGTALRADTATFAKGVAVGNIVGGIDSTRIVDGSISWADINKNGGLSVSGNVGIGTSLLTPNRRVQIFGGDNLSSSFALVVKNLAGEDLLTCQNDASVGIGYGGGLNVLRSGFVGIGISNPVSKLHVADVNGGFFFDGSMELFNRFKSTATTSSIGRDLMFSAQDAGITPDLYIKNNGNVLIGTTTSSGAKLDVEGNVRIGTGAAGSSLLLSGKIGVSYSYTIENNSSNYLNIIPAATAVPAVSIGSNGNVGIGTTSPKGSLSVMPNTGNYSEQFTVSGWSPNTNVDDIVIGFNMVSSNNYPVKIDPAHGGWAIQSRTPKTGVGDGNGSFSLSYSPTSSALSIPFISFTPSNGSDSAHVVIGSTTPQPNDKLTVGGDIRSAGTMYATGNWSSSDRRFKSSITPLDSSLSKINQLQGVSYTWNRNAFPNRNFPEGKQIGLIAQDVEKVIPEVVHTDAEGYKSLSYDKLTALLIEAVKAQQEEIAALKDEVKLLKESVVK